MIEPCLNCHFALTYCVWWHFSKHTLLTDSAPFVSVRFLPNRTTLHIQQIGLMQPKIWANFRIRLIGWLYLDFMQIVQFLSPPNLSQWFPMLQQNPVCLRHSKQVPMVFDHLRKIYINLIKFATAIKIALRDPRIGYTGLLNSFNLLKLFTTLWRVII